MAVYREDIVNIELESGTVFRSFLNHSIGSGDNMANRFGVRLFRDGEPVSAESATVTGLFMAPDGTRYVISETSWPGSTGTEGNKAYVQLPGICYAVTGQFTLAIKLSGGGVEGTMRIVDGTVEETGEDGAVVPTSTIPATADIIAAYEEAVDAMGGSVRFDAEQSLSSAQKETARENIGAADAESIGKEVEKIGSSVIGSAYATVPDVLNGSEAQKLFGYSAENERTSTPANSPLFLTRVTGGNFVKKIKLNVIQAGSLSVGCYKSSEIEEDAAYNEGYYVRLGTFHAETTGTQILELMQPAYIPEGYVLTVGEPEDTMLFAYGDDGLDRYYFYRNSSNVIKLSTRYCGIDVFCIDAPIDKNNMIPLLLTMGEKTTEEIYNSYDAQNSSVSSAGSFPLFPYPYITNAVVTRLRANIHDAGTLSIGIYKKEIVPGETYDEDYYEQKFILTITETGDLTINFPAQLYIPAGYYLAIGQPRDTATFAYGNYGIQKGYVYTGASTRELTLTMSRAMGIVVYGDSIRIKDNPKSTFNGKKLSIFGDSISTFTGWIPTGNAVYYNGTNAGVRYVDDTWWMKTIKALQFDLLVNNSWSGRAVSSIRDGQTGHTTDAGYKAANVEQLKSGSTLPEVIIVKLGINDFNNECPLGSYDGRTTVPTDPSTFSGAYAMMLDLIMTKYPLAEVYCCTLMACEKNGGIGFPEINGNGNTIDEFNAAIRQLAEAFGAKVINHDACGITYYNLETYMGDYSASTETGLHPNASGHSLIANETIHEMDNAVRTRY